MDFDYEMDFNLDPDVYQLEAEPVYLTAKSYSTETLTKNAAMDLRYAYNNFNFLFN